LFQQFYNQTDRLVSFSNKEKELIESELIYREIPAAYRLVDVGDVCKEIFFINKGCIRMYYLKDGEEKSGFLFTENLFVNAFESFLTGTPSMQVIESVENCQLLVLTKASLDKLYQSVPKFNILFRKMLELRFVNAQKVVASFILDKPEARYMKLLENQPELLDRFPQHMLASYLGITPVSLSRIRKRILQEKKG